MYIDKIRVLVVDDSVFARKIVSDILSESSNIEVVGTAINGYEALEMVEKLKPDVVTLDIEMPRLDGIETLRQLMIKRPTPVVVLSSLTTHSAQVSLQALQIGAVDVMAKPQGTHSIGLAAHGDELIAKVLSASKVEMSRLQPINKAATHRKTASAGFTSPDFPVVIIASSTGGPRALRMLVPSLSGSNGAAYVIVQHLPEGFSAAMAQDLNTMTSLNVREASNGEMLHSGDVLVAKAGYHLLFEKNGTTSLVLSPPLWGVRPSADVTMVSAVPVFGSRLIGVVLTGMGRDGADGLRLIKESGGRTIAEHESSCVVYGMPRVAIESGVVDVVTPLQLVGSAINVATAKVAEARKCKLNAA